jgi:rSAM/selenodomain-associated transferase 1
VTKGLIIFAREPVPGKVKTRLGRDIGYTAAANLYSAMLDDVLESAAGLEGVRPLLFWACDDASIPSCPALTPMESFEQCGATLGQRMADAFEQAFGSGCTVCCIIGTDSPDLPTEYIRQAFDLLCRDEAEVVFGPARDGGYYLLGLRQSWPGLFEDIAWGTPEVLAISVARARGLGLRTSLLPLWYDIDTLDDLSRLLDSPGSNAPRTREAAERLLSKGQQPPSPGPIISPQGNPP